VAQNAITNFLDQYFGAGGTRTWDYQQVQDESMPGGWQPTYTSSRRQPQAAASTPDTYIRDRADDPNAMIYCNGKFVNKQQYRAGACRDATEQAPVPEAAKVLPPLAQAQRSIFSNVKLPTESMIPKGGMPEPEGATRRIQATRRLPAPEGSTQRRMPGSPSLSGLLPLLSRSGPLMAFSPSVLAGEQAERGMMGEAMPGFNYVPPQNMSLVPNRFDPTLGGLFTSQSFDTINDLLLGQYMRGISPYADVQEIRPEEAMVNAGTPYPMF